MKTRTAIRFRDVFDEKKFFRENEALKKWIFCLLWRVHILMIIKLIEKLKVTAIFFCHKVY